MTDIPVKDQIYRHFKGNLYRIVTVAIHSETGERMVVYQALYGDYTVYVRELSMFMGKVDRNRYPDADQEERFKLLTQIIGQESGASLQVRTSPDEPIRMRQYRPPKRAGMGCRHRQQTITAYRRPARITEKR